MQPVSGAAMAALLAQHHQQAPPVPLGGPQHHHQQAAALALRQQLAAQAATAQPLAPLHQQQQQQQQQQLAALAAQHQLQQLQQLDPQQQVTGPVLPAQQQQQQQVWVREVWEGNLEREFALLRAAVERYPYVAMDTEFPGVVAKPIGNFRSAPEYHYQMLRCNVDLLSIIQLGLTVSDAKGNKPLGFCTWQFNFQFNLEEDMYAQDSIDLLTKSGINFRKNQQLGIDPNHFAELLISSGLVLLPDVTWISFHSGYDFGYLLKVLTCAALPKTEEQFFHMLHIYFPTLFDIKFMVRSLLNLKGGLQDIADELQVARIGPQHQAGSDSLLTSDVFFKLRLTTFENVGDQSRFEGHLFGLSM